MAAQDRVIDARVGRGGLGILSGLGRGGGSTLQGKVIGPTGNASDFDADQDWPAYQRPPGGVVQTDLSDSLAGMRSSSATGKRIRVALGLCLLILVGWTVFGTLGRGSGTGTSVRGLATVRTFSGHWGGHGKGLDIEPSGRGRETVSIARRESTVFASLSFRIIRVTGTHARADADFLVTGSRNWSSVDPSGNSGWVGDGGTLRLRRGVITESITGDLYCAPRHVCGA